jgi:hypothetical protein
MFDWSQVQLAWLGDPELEHHQNQAKLKMMADAYFFITMFGPVRANEPS